jgi:hypothetical protein
MPWRRGTVVITSVNTDAPGILGQTLGFNPARVYLTLIYN